MNKLPFYLLAIAMIGLSSCEDDNMSAPEPPSTNNVLIANTGAATAGTGSLSSYRPVDQTVEHNLYQKANVLPMGSGLENIFIDGNRTFLMLAGDGEVAVVESDSYKLIRRIKGVGSPTAMIKVDDDKFYITDELNGAVQVYSYERDRIIETIYTGMRPMAFERFQDMIFVANNGEPGTISNDLTVIQAEEDTIMRQIRVGDNPNSVQLDSGKVLWVLSSGYVDQDPLQNTPGVLMSFPLMSDSGVYHIDSVMYRDSLVFADVNDKPQGLTINQDSSGFYFLDQEFEANLRFFQIGQPVVPMSNFVPGDFYGMSFDRVNSEIYLSMPKDFESIGEVLRLDENGVEVDRFQAGLIPKAFDFK